ncbi:MAG TPA: signal peptidase II [Candidatus Bipolaricaulota bacterium]|nr:signal peptidase II [Candidatus Bipolaricaulota bacterium]
MSFNKTKLSVFIIPFVLLLLDQLSKYLVLSKIQREFFLIDLSYFKFSISLVKNENLAFSIPLPQVLIFLIVGILLVAIVFFLIRTFQKGQSLSVLSLSLIFCGATSNLIDRIIHGAVIDFFSIQLANWSFAVFNLADTFIVCGALILIFKESFAVREIKK